MLFVIGRSLALGRLGGGVMIGLGVAVLFVPRDEKPNDQKPKH